MSQNKQKVMAPEGTETVGRKVPRVLHVYILERYTIERNVAAAFARMQIVPFRALLCLNMSEL